MTVESSLLNGLLGAVYRRHWLGCRSLWWKILCSKSDQSCQNKLSAYFLRGTSNPRTFYQSFANSATNDRHSYIKIIKDAYAINYWVTGTGSYPTKSCWCNQSLNWEEWRTMQPQLASTFHWHWPWRVYHLIHSADLVTLTFLCFDFSWWQGCEPAGEQISEPKSEGGQCAALPDTPGQQRGRCTGAHCSRWARAVTESCSSQWAPPGLACISNANCNNCLITRNIPS